MPKKSGRKVKRFLPRWWLILPVLAGLVYWLAMVTPGVFQATAGGVVTRKVMVLNFNPVLEDQGNQTLTQYLGWNDPHVLTDQYNNSLLNNSRGYLEYQVVDWQEIDDYPVKADGFDYTDATYLDCWNNNETCHRPDTADYLAIINQYQVCEAVNNNQIDELWLFGGPYFGYDETAMAGPDAIWTMGVIYPTSCNRQLPIMGFNYERNADMMLHDFGHRVEEVMSWVYGWWTPGEQSHDFNKFTGGELYSPGHASCGSVHLPPNAAEEYDWDNQNPVTSDCDDWLNFPNLTGARELINCTQWNCDELGHMQWWLAHLPAAAGVSGEYLNNWWKYLIDYPNAHILPDPAEPSPSWLPSPSPSALPSLSPTPSPLPVCVNSCGNGVCEALACNGSDCPCAEDQTSCPQDCPASQATKLVIYAAGTPYAGVYPNMNLRINNQVVKKWFQVKFNPKLRIFGKFTYVWPKEIKATDKVEVMFTNDKLGRDLRVDKIVIGGRVHQAEAETVYSSCLQKNAKTEWLRCSGYFRFEPQLTSGGSGGN